MNITFRTIADPLDLRRLREFLHKQALGYPDYEAWVETVCIPDIDNGWKSAIVAYSDGRLVGNAIYQQHKQLPNTREFKNLRVLPGHRQRDLGHFLLRQVEEEEKGTFERIICDVNADQERILGFMLKCGYRELCRAPLYATSEIDVILVKEFSPCSTSRS